MPEMTSRLQFNNNAPYFFLRTGALVPANIYACTTTRIGGYSQTPFASLNLGDHVNGNLAHEALILKAVFGMTLVGMSLEELSQTYCCYRMRLFNMGHGKATSLEVDREWLVCALGEKISSINWADAAADVERFLKPIEQKSLSLWGEGFYMSKLSKLDKLLQ